LTFGVYPDPQISGANVVIHDQKPGATEGLVIVSGTQDQIYSAQCLIHGFILCGQTAP
jgi:poly(rC)-binding protein 2/3/4